MAIPTLPAESSTDWYEHYTALDAAARGLDGTTTSSLTSALAAKAADSAVVHLAGAETVSGVKTFSASPVVPTPTTSGQAAPKSYVDSVAGGGGSGTPADGSVTDAKVATGAAIALDKTADSTGSTGRLAMTNAERTKLSGVATSATANSSDATLLARANHTGTQAISTVTSLQTTLDGKVTASSTGAKLWIGTQTAYDAISSKDATTLYAITS